MQLIGKTLKWPAHREPDVIGYRVYRADQEGLPFQMIATIKAGRPLSFADHSTRGIYYVTAVDISGNESAPSNFVSLSSPVQTQKEIDNLATVKDGPYTR